MDWLVSESEILCLLSTHKRYHSGRRLWRASQNRCVGDCEDVKRRGMTILVTGHSGFVGRHVVPELIASGHEVICYGRRAPAAELCCRFIQGDLGTRGGFDEIPWSEIEGVLHLATAGVKASTRHGNTDGCLRVNVTGLLTLLDTLRARSPRLARVVITPTFYELALSNHPALFADPYIATKYIATQAFKVWASGFAGQASMAMLFQAFGPGDESGSVLSYIVSRLRAGEVAQMGSGHGLRDWIYIDDVASGLSQLFDGELLPGLNSHDLGSGRLHTIRHMAESIARALGLGPDRLEFDPSRDRLDCGLRFAAVHPLSGWKPRTDLATGIHNLIHT